MTGQGQALNFDDLLQTVQESARGRWFLSEFESRLRSSQTGDIVNAIKRLEGVIAEQVKGGGADAALVARARTAIAAARREIAAMEGANQQLSDEGRLFAKLADMARTAFAADASATPLVTAGVSRALRLVDEIDRDLGPAPAANAAEYFPPETQIFEQPPKQVQAVIDSPSKHAVREVDRGAKLVIRKADEAPAAVVPAAAETVQAPEAPPPAETAEPVAPAATVTNITPAPPKTSRVVIIRRKPEELMDVPLVDESSTGNAA